MGLSVGGGCTSEGPLVYRCLTVRTLKRGGWQGLGGHVRTGPLYCRVKLACTSPLASAQDTWGSCHYPSLGKSSVSAPPSACFHLSPAGHFRNSTHSPEGLQHPPARGCFILHCRQDMGQDSGGAPAQWRRREATKGWQFAGVRGRGGMPPTDSKGL